MSFAGDEHPVGALGRAVCTNLTAIAFICGAWGAVVTTSMPQAVKTASKAVVNLEWRSRIRWVNPCPAPGKVASEFGGQLGGPGRGGEAGNA